MSKKVKDYDLDRYNVLLKKLSDHYKARYSDNKMDYETNGASSEELADLDNLWMSLKENCRYQMKLNFVPNFFLICLTNLHFGKTNFGLEKKMVLCQIKFSFGKKYTKKYEINHIQTNNKYYEKRQIKNNIHPTIFEEKEVRRVWHNEQWYFAVVDVIAILSGSTNPQVYWRVLKKRLIDEGSNETVTKCNGLKMVAEDGKMRLIDAGNLEVIFRIIQSIPSPKAEPFKQWLAKVGQERIEEIQDPERAIVRAKRIYEQKGYNDDWIAKRMRGINVRNTLTDEWQERGAKRRV